MGLLKLALTPALVSLFIESPMKRQNIIEGVSNCRLQQLITTESVCTKKKIKGNEKSKSIFVHPKAVFKKIYRASFLCNTVV